MRQNLEPLKYSTLAPSRYTVYLHPREFARLEGIIPILQEQTTRALTEELATAERRSRAAALVRPLAGDAASPRSATPRPTGRWSSSPDPDGDMDEGDILIDSELVLPASPDLGVGERTRRITTVHAGQRTTTREQTISRTQPAAGGGRARPHQVRRRRRPPLPTTSSKDSVTIGRGGIAYPVDIRIASSADVSREHARIRRDPATGRFFLIDLSSLGTTLNGRHVPQGLRRGRRDQARERRGNAAAGRGAHRPGRHRVPRVPDQVR